MKGIFLLNYYAPNEENLPNLTRKNIKGEGLNHDGRNKWRDNRRYPKD